MLKENLWILLLLLFLYLKTWGWERGWFSCDVMSSLHAVFVSVFTIWKHKMMA